MSRTRQKVGPATHRVIGRASESLREASRSVREQVLADHAEIVATANELLREVEASGTVQAIRVLFQTNEQEVLDAIDAYARDHGLNSRAQVVRVALGKLLKIEVGVPKWGWTKGRSRKAAS
jgi:hypothetical protein